MASSIGLGVPVYRACADSSKAFVSDMSMGMGSRRVGDRSGTLSLTPPAIGGGKGARPGDVIEPRRCLSMLTLRYASARSLLAPLPPP
jgi:hypothetical protein